MNSAPSSIPNMYSLTHCQQISQGGWASREWSEYSLIRMTSHVKEWENERMPQPQYSFIWSNRFNTQNWTVLHDIGDNLRLKLKFDRENDCQWDENSKMGPKSGQFWVLILLDHMNECWGSGILSFSHSFMWEVIRMREYSDHSLEALEPTIR